LAQEQGVEQDGHGLSLNVLLANTLANLEQKRVDFPSLIAVLSLFNLFSVLNNSTQGQPPKAGLGMSGAADLAGLLAGMLGGGAPGAEPLSGLMQKQGKGLNPQMLLSLLSLLSEAKSSAAPHPEGARLPAGVVESSQSAPPERRVGRGVF
jgi:hypothetical protein